MQFYKKITVLILILMMGFVMIGEGEARTKSRPQRSEYKIEPSITPEEPIYRWEIDPSYQNKLQGGKIGQTSQQGGAYYSTENLICPTDKIVLAINGKESEAAWDYTYYSTHGLEHNSMNYYIYGPDTPENTDVAGLKLFCGDGFLSVNPRPSSISSTESWGRSSSDMIRTSEYLPHDYSSWTLANTLNYRDFDPPKGIRKLSAEMAPSYFPISFFVGMRGQLLELDWDNMYDSSADPYYTWDTIIQTRIGDPITNSNIYEDTVNCPTSGDDVAYYVSGIKLYLTKISDGGEELVQGVKIYCSRFNRVQSN